MRKQPDGTIVIDRAEAMWLADTLDAASGAVMIEHGDDELAVEIANARNALEALHGEHTEATIPGVGIICPECDGKRYEGDPGARVAPPCWRCDAIGRVVD